MPSSARTRTKKSKKSQKRPSKRCKEFCATTFVETREQMYAKRQTEEGRPPKPLGPFMKKLYQETCERIYCNPGCQCDTRYFMSNSRSANCKKILMCPKKTDRMSCAEADKAAAVVRPDFVRSVSQKRKQRLQAQGVVSVCRDLPKELPDHYSKDKF